MSQWRFVYAVRLIRPYIRARLVSREIPLNQSSSWWRSNLLQQSSSGWRSNLFTNVAIHTTLTSVDFLTTLNNLLSGEDPTFSQMLLCTQHSINCGYTHHNHSQETYLANNENPLTRFVESVFGDSHQSTITSKWLQYTIEPHTRVIDDLIKW